MCDTKLQKWGEKVAYVLKRKQGCRGAGERHCLYSKAVGRALWRKQGLEGMEGHSGWSQELGSQASIGQDGIDGCLATR